MPCALQAWYVEHKVLADAIFLAACAASAALSFRHRDRPWPSALLLALAGALAAFACSTDDFLHRWDEQFHALVAKNLALHPLMPTLYETPVLPSTGYWDSTHVWLFHPPFPLWLMAGARALLGPCELALRMPSVLAHAAATVAVCFAGRRLFRARVGWLGALLFGLNGRLIELAGGRAGGDHPDSIFTSLFTVAMALFVAQAQAPRRWRPLVAGALVGCLVLTKWLTGFFALALFGFLLLRRGEVRARWLEGLVALAAALAVVVPWEAYALVHYPAEHALFMQSNADHVAKALDAHSGSPFFHLVRIPRVYGEASAVAILWFLWARAWRAREAAAQLLALWFAVPYLFWAFVHTKMENHVMFASAPLCLMVAVAALAAWEALASRQGLQRAGLATLALAWVALPLRFTLERWRLFRRDEPERQLALALKALPGPEAGRVVYFGAQCRCAPAAMYYSGQPAYPFDADEARRAQVEAQGYRAEPLPELPATK